MSKSIQLTSLHSAIGAPMLFGALSEPLRERLRQSSPEREFADRQIIQQRGEVADGFWLIEAGAVTVGQYLASGEFRAVTVLGPGDSYGELALFSARPRVVDAVSRGPSRARYIQGQPFLEALGEDPGSMLALLGAVSAQLQQVLDLLANLRRGTNPARMAGLLVSMLRDSTDTATVSVTQEELAELLGVTRVTANAALRELENAQLIERGYGAIRVRQIDRLIAMALG